MDSTGEPGAGLPETAAGALVVQTGRRRGARRPLTGPVTVIVRAAGCDIRLDVAGVAALHCVLAPGPDGAVLRDLASRHGTAVNGSRVATAVLRDGDLITVGPF